MLQYFLDCLSSLAALLHQFNLTLFVGLLHKEVRLSDYLLAALKDHIELGCLLEYCYEVARLEVLLPLFKVLETRVCLLVQFLRLELHVNEVGVLKEPSEFFQLSSLELAQLFVKTFKKL